MSHPVTAVVIGGGARGTIYACYALDFPEKFKIVGVAEPRSFYSKRLMELHQIPAEKVFKNWTDAAACEKFADCALITTQDQMHKEPAIAFAQKGYHILLEKPMAVSYADCCEIVAACQKAGVMLAVCHVLRYTPQARKVTELIKSGAIGDIVNIQHLEPVGYWHFAHSYVRGNWRNTESSTFALLAKCCHDLDLIQMWMSGKKCISVSSFGSLKHFTADNKPPGSGSRCVDCAVEQSCPFSAKKIYLKKIESGNNGWPMNIIAEVPDIESVAEAIATGPYGRCVYECDNDVVDNQVVTMQFEGGASVTFTMIAFSEYVGQRIIKIFGTKGELTCDFTKRQLVQFDFLQHESIVFDFSEECSAYEHSRLTGQGGADFFTIESFVKAVKTGDSSHILTGPLESLYSHYLCFAAEKSRRENRVINLTSEEYILA